MAISTVHCPGGKSVEPIHSYHRWGLWLTGHSSRPKSPHPFLFNNHIIDVCGCIYHHAHIAACELRSTLFTLHSSLFLCLPLASLSNICYVFSSVLSSFNFKDEKMNWSLCLLCTSYACVSSSCCKYEPMLFSLSSLRNTSPRCAQLRASLF